MAREDLTNEQIEQMGRENPGSAAEYLKLRREELEAEKRREREEEARSRYVEAFVRAGGTRSAAKEDYERRLDEEASRRAREQDEAALLAQRRNIASRL